jgi:hypothetical protein
MFSKKLSSPTIDNHHTHAGSEVGVVFNDHKEYFSSNPKICCSEHNQLPFSLVKHFRKIVWIRWTLG